MSNSIGGNDRHTATGRETGIYRAFSDATGVTAANTAVGSSPVFATALRGARSQSWDPHDVWLNRVKKPRDQQPR